jgi:hypothetical protein
MATYLTANEVKIMIELCDSFILNVSNHEREKIIKENIVRKLKTTITKRKNKKADKLLSSVDRFNSNQEETNLIGYKVVATKVVN